MKQTKIGLYSRYFFLMLLLALCACKEQEPDSFTELNGIYFNNRTASQMLQDSINVTFVYESANEMQIPVRIQLLGRPADYDRPVDISVNSTDADSGTDYMLPLQPFIAAGNTSLTYPVTLIRTESLKQHTKTIELEVRANEYFSLPVDNEIQAGGDTVSFLRYKIEFSDMFTNPPSTWITDLIGEFAQEKFNLLCRVLRIPPSDFNDATKMTMAKLLFISNEMNFYIKQEMEKRQNGQPYDTEIINPKTKEPWKF